MASVFIFKVKPSPEPGPICDACLKRILPGQKTVRVRYARYLTTKNGRVSGQFAYYHTRCFKGRPGRRQT